MNKKQADDIINLIKANIATKKQNVEEIYNQDVMESSNFSSVNVENEFSMLGKMHKKLSGEVEIRQAIKSYIDSRRYNDSNINEIAKQYKSKIKSLKQFESDLFNIFNSNGIVKKFDRFTYASYVDIQRALNNSVNATPSALLKLMNENRNAIELDGIQSYDNDREVLSSYFISKYVQCKQNDVNLERLVENVNIFTKKYGQEINVSNQSIDYLPVVKQVYKVVCDNFTNNKFFDFIASDNKFDADIVNGLQNFDKMSLQEKNDIRASVNKVAALLLTNRVLALTVEDKAEYIQISKIIRTDICNQLCNITNKFDNCAVTYAISQMVENGFVEICNKLGLDAKACYNKLSNNGAKINGNNLSLSKLALCEQLEETNNAQVTLKEVFKMDFKKIAKQDYYVAIVNNYIEKFNKLLSERKFVANSKIDLNLESLKVKSISLDAKNLIERIESKDHATEEQFKVFIDAHAYGVVSNSVLKGLSKQYFDIDVDQMIAQSQEAEVVANQSVEGEQTQRLLPEIVYSQELTPVIQKYEPNFIIINENNDANETAMAENNTPTDKENIIDVEVVEKNSDNDKKVKAEEKATNTDEKIYVVEQEIVNDFRTTQETKSVENVKPEERAETPKQEEKPQQPEEAKVEVKKQPTKAKEQKPVETKTNKPVASDKPKAQKEKLEKVSSAKEQKMDEENKKLNEQNEKQRREIEELKRQLEQAKKQNSTPVNTKVNKAEKTAILSSKIEAVLADSFRSSIKNLANLDFDLKASELNKSILHTNTLSANSRKLLTSLNTYLSLTKSENEQVKRNSFINDNTEQTAKDIMKFEFYLKKLTKTFADKIAESIENDDKPIDMLITESIEKYCEKYVQTMAQNKKAEVAVLKDKYGDDEYEFDNRLDILNDKYYGSNGLLNSLKSNYLSLLTKDIVISQIKEIDNAETNGMPYMFDKQKVNRILDEIINNDKSKEQESTFIKE